MKSPKLIYMIVDRDNEGRENILGVYTSYRRVMKAHKELGPQEHYYYGPHVDVHGVNGDTYFWCGIDEPEYNHTSKNRDGKRWTIPKKYK